MPQRSWSGPRDVEIPKLFIRCSGIIRLQRHRRVSLQQQTFFDSGWRGIPPPVVPPRSNVSGYGGFRGCGAVVNDFEDGVHAQLHRYARVTRDFLRFYFLTSLAEFTVWYLASVVTSRPLHCVSTLFRSLSLSNFRLPLFSELCSVMTRLFPPGPMFMFYRFFLFNEKTYCIFCL